MIFPPCLNTFGEDILCKLFTRGARELKIISLRIALETVEDAQNLKSSGDE